MRSPLLAAMLVALAACGGDDDDDSKGAAGAAGSSTAPACTVSATISEDTSHVVTGLGEATCPSVATINVETCLQWDADGAFADVQCVSLGGSGGVSVKSPSATNCGASLGHHFRARVNVSIDGTALPESLSSEIVCD